MTSLYDRDSQRIGLSGRLWKLNDTGFFSTSRPWKQRWAYSDGKTLNVWATPDQEGPPKHVFNLRECKIEDAPAKSVKRKFAFSITVSRPKRKSYTLAADKVVEYEQWMTFLSEIKIKDDEEKTLRLEDVQLDSDSDDGEPEEDKFKRLIREFFLEKNASISETNPIISEHHLHDLIMLVSSHGSTPGQQDLTWHSVYIQKYFFRRCGHFVEFISMREFLEFWDEFNSGNLMSLWQTRLPNSSGGVLPGYENLSGNKYTEDLLSLGILDPMLRSNLIVPSVNLLLKTQVPTVKQITIVDGPGQDSPLFENECTNWNDAYQDLVSECSTTYSASSNEDGVHCNYEDTQARTSEEVLRGVATSLQLIALQGAFVRTAVEGTRLIIDEYTLPDEFKSTRVLHTPLHKEASTPPKYQKADMDDIESVLSEDTESDSSSLATSPNKAPISFTLQDYYSKHADGALERDEDSQRPTPKTTAGGDSWSVSTYTESNDSDEGMGGKNPYDIANSGPDHDLREDHVHIDSDHVFKGLIFTVLACKADEAVDGEPTSHRLKQAAATDELLHKLSGHEHRGGLAVKRALATSCNERHLRTPLSTIVDYGGFRVQVVCPLAIHADSLLYDGTLTASDPNKAQIEKEVHELVGSVLGELNIALSPLTEEPAPLEDPKVVRVPEGMEVHEDENKNKYLLNLSHALPAQIPRPSTNDLVTRRLRPEYLMHYHSNFDSRALTTRDEGDGGDSDDDGTAIAGSAYAAKRDAIKAKAAHLLTASSHFFVTILPELTRVLDKLLTLPVDSATLSTCFHSYGVGLHHMGTVYALSKSSVTRRMLLTEAIARTCKVLLNNLLRKLVRKDKTLSMIAHRRERSTYDDYDEHMKASLRRKQDQAVDFFNLVLGSSAESSSFWKNALPDAVFQKFSLTMPASMQAPNKSQFVHVPQLFLAMQDQTGVRFGDHTNYELDNPPPLPFVHEDITDYSTPRAKALALSHNKLSDYGLTSVVDRMAEAYLGADLAMEAAYLFRLRMSMQLSSYTGSRNMSHHEAHELAVTSYKLCLALYRNCCYKEAIDHIVEDMKQRGGFTALNGRFLSLLMCCKFKNGDVKGAMEAYDAGSAIYMYTLGPHHPVHIVHMLIMADLYYHGKHLLNCHLMLTTAHELSQTTGSENQLQFVYIVYKLACVNYSLARKLKDEYYSVRLESAFEGFQEALTIYENLYSLGMDVRCETLECLYSLAVTSKALKRQELCFEFLSSARDNIFSYYFDGDPKRAQAATFNSLPLVAISALSLLVDIYMQRNDCDQALETLMVVWNSVQSRPSDLTSVAEVNAKLACKVLSVLLTALPYPTRALIDSICHDIESGEEAKYGIDVIDAWSNAKITLFNGLLLNDPCKYFSGVIDEVLRGEIQEATPDKTKAIRKSKSAYYVSSAALQVVIMRRLATAMRSRK